MVVVVVVRVRAWVVVVVVVAGAVRDLRWCWHDDGAGVLSTGKLVANIL